MNAHTFTSRQFNQNPSLVKRAAADGPVFVTEHGKQALVVMNIAEYRRLKGTGLTALEHAMSIEPVDIDFEPPRMTGFGARPFEVD